MRKSIAISNDERYQCKISFLQAQNLLHQGLAKIVQYFPLTVKMKNKIDFPFLDSDGECIVCSPQLPNPCLSNAKKLPRGLYEQATIF